MAKKITTLENSSEFEINGIKGTVPIGGIHFVYNAICAATVGMLMGLSQEQIKSRCLCSPVIRKMIGNYEVYK